MSSNTTLWTEPRIDRISIALACALTVALIIAYYLHLPLVTSADFPGFYAPAVIAWSGQWQSLYDPALQQTIENAGWPEFDGAYLMSVYPPYLAYLLQPLAALQPIHARHVFTLISVVAYTLACRLLFGFRWRRTAVFFMCFPPTLYGVLGGQNTAWSLLILAVTLRTLSSSASRTKEFLAGIVLGLWLVKPQFGLPAIVFICCLRQWHLAAGAAATGLVLFALAAWKLGIDWPFVWVNALSQFSDQNYISNAMAQVSIPGFLHSHVGAIPAIDLLLVTALFLLPLLAPLPSTAARFTFFASLIPVFSPQTLFYDLSISAFALVYVWRLWSASARTSLALALPVFAVLLAHREDFPFSPLVVVSVTIASLTYWRLRCGH